MDRDEIMLYIRKFTDKSIDVKNINDGYLFFIDGERYVHECSETGVVADAIRDDAVFNVSFPSLGAGYLIKRKRGGSYPTSLSSSITEHDSQ